MNLRCCGASLETNFWVFESASQSCFGRFQAEAQEAIGVLRAEIAEERALHVQQIVQISNSSSTPDVHAPDMKGLIVQEIRALENILSNKFSAIGGQMASFEARIHTLATTAAPQTTPTLTDVSEVCEQLSEQCKTFLGCSIVKTVVLMSWRADFWVLRLVLTSLGTRFCERLSG